MSRAGTDTIAAIATPPGRGGVGIVRCSGPRVRHIADAVLSGLPAPRRAAYRHFKDAEGRAIDHGIALFFPGPASFTGEDVLELQGHGGPVVMDILLERVLQLGARVARPGEFSERAFLNDKLDLVQAEAVADLIDSETRAAARLATRTLEGEFSRRVDALQEAVTGLRMYVEAAIDFPDEDIDFLADASVSERLLSITEQTRELLESAKVGRTLRDGMTLVIAGRPNAGKSSLLNALAGYEAAIVTDIPGTTRDVLREHIEVDGMPLHLVDTAGLRESTDLVEQKGVARARGELERADRVLWVYDGAADPDHAGFDAAELPRGVPVTFVRNKADLAGEPAGLREHAAGPEVTLSATDGAGVELLRQHLRSSMGYETGTEGEFIARRRHLTALKQVLTHLGAGDQALTDGAGELLAEDLRLAQASLSEITGAFTADDLLGEIFSSFCIGK